MTRIGDSPVRSWTPKIQAIKDKCLYRQMPKIDQSSGSKITIAGKQYLNFASNNYLNLAQDKRIKNAFQEGLEKWGSGSTASRYVVGNTFSHEVCEAALAEWTGQEAALLMSTGYMANIAVLASLPENGDVLLLDRSCHASLVDGARLSHATTRVYPHNDLHNLEKQLKKYKETNVCTWIVTESLFSMEGDFAPWEHLSNLAEKYEAYLLLDEAHALGVYGEEGSGLLGRDVSYKEQLIRVGTLGKSVGLAGGFVAGSAEMIDYLRNVARASIYSTGMPPAMAFALSVAITAVREADKARVHLQSLIEEWGAESQIIPHLVGSNKEVLSLSEELKENGFWVPAMRFPTVKKGEERLRISLMSGHTKEDIKNLKKLLHRRRDVSKKNL